MKSILLLISASLIATMPAVAQKGSIVGRVTDGETSDGLFGATIVVQGTTTGTSVDFDGNFSLELEAGSYTIQASFVSYKTQIVESVLVVAGETTKLDVVLQPDISVLDEIVVSGTIMKSSEAGIVTFQRKSPNVLDAISSQTFRKTGDRDLASAMKRVTGVSIQGGKFVYVRGLGDRYTRTTLNGMTIPGLDPDRNDVQIDIFPTSVLENVVVYKTSSPNLPADFSGGIVDVETKDFPDEKSTSLSIGFRFNPEMHFNSDFLSYGGGKLDWLGFDDGTRALPFPSTTAIPDVSTGSATIEKLTRSLNPALAARKQRSLLNTVFSFNHGNQMSFRKATAGYTAIVNYQSGYEHYDNIQFGEYTKDDDQGQYNFFEEEVRKGDLSRRNVLWSALLSGALKFDRNTFSASIFRTQHGSSEASSRYNYNFDETQATLYENILTYSQRSVTNMMLLGTHQIGEALRLEWRNSLTTSRSYDPDFRSTSISVTDPAQPTLNRGDGAGIQRFWRDLNEFNENLKLDFIMPYGKANKFQFGVMGLYKDRTFEVHSFLLDATTRSGVPLDPDYFLESGNVWTSAEKTGTYIEGNYEAPNNFDASLSILSGYVMNEATIGPVKGIYGVRVERADMYYTGTDVLGTKYDNDHTLGELDILPSVNLVLALNDRMNLRTSYGRTLARPSFKEKSGAQIFDPITKRFFNGNLALHQTTINNYDLRWEKYSPGNAGDLISGSVFLKEFNGHIELVTFDVATNNVRPRNAGRSIVYGAEFEIRQTLAFISPALSGLSVGGNASIARSEVDMSSIIVNESGMTELESRQNNAREHESVPGVRAMAGQSPYLINGYVNYADRTGLFNINLSYNVQGKSLFIVGVGAVPDIYSLPFHSLDLNAFRNFGPNNRHRVTIGVNNILKAERRDSYQGFSGAEAVYSNFKPGRTYALTYSFSF